MRISKVALFALAVAPVLSETIQGVVIYSRHGDRTSKVYKGYQVTQLGAQQLYDSGSFYRARYIDSDASHKIVNVSSDEYKPAQIWASGPDQSVLLQTATNFLQGLYPPLEKADVLANGTETIAPLDGYQFVQVHAEDEKDPDSIWLKGSDSCPAYTNASSTYRNSTEYLDLVASTAAFYEQFNETLRNNLSPSKISFANAYDVFDLINTASIHNDSNIVSPEQLDQLRYYANVWESGMNFNQTMPDRSIGGATLGGAFLKQLNETFASDGKLKLSLMTGSYNTFLQFFGRMGLTTLPGNNNFTGLPNYGSSMVFELFSESNSVAFPDEAGLNVRFLFRNGTDSSTPLVNLPLFGQNRLSIPYQEFQELMKERSVMDPKSWCAACQKTDSFCSQKEYSPEQAGFATAGKAPNTHKPGLSVTEAGVVGAMVTLGFVAIVGALVWFMRRRESQVTVPSATARKHSKDGTSSIETPV